MTGTINITQSRHPKLKSIVKSGHTVYISQIGELQCNRYLQIDKTKMKWVRKRFSLVEPFETEKEFETRLSYCKHLLAT